MALAPDVLSIGKTVAAGLKKVKVTMICDVCREKYEAVMSEAPPLGLALIGEKKDPLQFAQDFYATAAKNSHPLHKVTVVAEYVDQGTRPYPPMKVSYV